MRSSTSEFVASHEGIQANMEALTLFEEVCFRYQSVTTTPYQMTEIGSQFLNGQGERYYHDGLPIVADRRAVSFVRQHTEKIVQRLLVNLNSGH